MVCGLVLPDGMDKRQSMKLWAVHKANFKLCLTEQRIMIKGLCNHTWLKSCFTLAWFHLKLSLCDLKTVLCLVHCFFFCLNVVWWLKQLALLLADIFIMYIVIYLIHRCFDKWHLGFCYCITYFVYFVSELVQYVALSSIMVFKIW